MRSAFFTGCPTRASTIRVVRSCAQSVHGGCTARSSFGRPSAGRFVQPRAPARSRKNGRAMAIRVAFVPPDQHHPTLAQVADRSRSGQSRWMNAFRRAALLAAAVISRRAGGSGGSKRMLFAGRGRKRSPICGTKGNRLRKTGKRDPRSRRSTPSKGNPPRPGHQNRGSTG